MLYRYKKKYGGLEPGRARELKLTADLEGSGKFVA
jgi:hypothetical protein